MQKMYFWDSLSVKDASHFLFFRNGPVQKGVPYVPIKYDTRKWSTRI